MKKTLNMLMTVCLVCWLCRLVFAQNTKEKSESLSYAFTKGDFVIGGLSPVHFSLTEAEEQQNPDSFTCRGRLNTRGFEAVEAMLFTMDMLNEGPLKDVVLPNITIGMDIKDTCGSAEHAVRESLNFSFIRKAHVKDQCSPSYEKEKFQTIAVVGAAYSGVSMAITNLFGLFYVPVVSYASTSSSLSNKVRFRYFLRTVPNDMLQAKVMADLVRKMKWNYVITLASESEYGRSGIEAFKRALDSFGDSYNVCIPVDERFTKRTTDAEFEEIFQKMRANSKARVVILFAQLQDATILIDRFRKHESMSKEKYVWIGSDAWADSKQVLKGNEDILRGMFGVVPEVVHIKEFDKYFTSFTDERRKRNPWMREYEHLKVAHNPDFYRDTFKHYPKAQYVMDAVLAVAYALHNMLGCQPYQDCSKKITKNLNQRKFLKLLEDVKFPGKSREQFSFDYLGDAIGVYDIRHLGLGDGNYDVVKAGKWGGGRECNILDANLSMSSCLDMDMKIIDMVNENLKNHTQEGIPFSTCSKDCPPGYHKNPERIHAKCCWECRLCSGNTITNQSNMDDCTACPRGYHASKNHSRCEPIQPTSLHWNDTLGVIIICISGAGILSVIYTFAVYYVYRETPVVRASSKELCYILLFGIAWCYATPIVFLINLTDQVCRAIPFVTGLSPAVIAGTLLTKTYRISRIFNRKLLKTGPPNFLSKKWQVLMVLCLAVVECLIGGGCVLFNETGSKLLISDSKKEVLKQCKELPDICTAIWWMYNMGLALTCTYQAFRTRKVPENYNEAKFITFTMVITCIVVMIFIPTYIGTKGIYRTTITCFVFIIGGSSTLSCMFVPKLYIILWRPEKNVPMQPPSSTISLGTISPSASFMRRLSLESNLSDKAREGRKTRIRSLPTIELSRPEDEDGEHLEGLKIKKTTRSFSLSPDMLSGGRTNPERGPERSPTRLFPSRRRGSLQGTSAMLSSMEMIEEGNEVEQFGASNESATSSGALDSRDLRTRLERLKLELYELQEKDGHLNAEDDKKSCEDDVFLPSDVENQNYDDNGEEYETSNSDSESKNPTTCASNLDNCQPEIQTVSTNNSLFCQNCGTIVSNINHDFLIEVLRAHMARNGSSQPGDKTKKNSENSHSHNTVTLPENQNGQNGATTRRGKSGILNQKPRDTCVARIGLDLNENKPAKKLRNPSYYRRESVSLPSLFSVFSQEDCALGLGVKRINNTEDMRKNDNKSFISGENCSFEDGLLKRPYSKSNGSVCNVLINGEESDFITENDKLLCEEDEEMETVL